MNLKESWQKLIVRPVLTPLTRILHLDNGAWLNILRPTRKTGRLAVEGSIRMGPNHVHAFITHPDGTIKDLGVSKNLLTNIGRDWLCGAIGAFIPAGGVGSPATGSSATSVTATGTPWTASNLGSPQLGLAGFRVYMPVTGLTTAPVYGNIVSNTSSVATVDQWWTAADGTGTTPASNSAFIIGAGGIASARFMALTTNASAASASDTTLTGEITASGAGRALATYAHTMGQATFTLQKSYSISGTLTAIHKMGLFPCLTAAGADLMAFETVLNQDATVGSGDTLTCVGGETRIRTNQGVAPIDELVGQEIEVVNRFNQWEKASVRSFGKQRLQRIEFADLSPVYATAGHQWWQADGTRVTTSNLKYVPFAGDPTQQAEVVKISDSGREEEVYCCVVPGSESFTLANGLITSNCTDTLTVSG